MFSRTTFVTVWGMIARWPVFPVEVLVISDGERAQMPITVNARDRKHATARVVRYLRRTLPNGWVAAVQGGWVVDKRAHGASTP